MPTICDAIARVAPVVGLGLMLAGMFGGPAGGIYGRRGALHLSASWGVSDARSGSDALGTARLLGPARSLETAGPVGIPA
jgi:hypothetical protein